VQCATHPPALLEPPEDPAGFTLKENNGTRETARFETDADGNVTRVWLRNEYVQRKS
jgi:hypothetical protein